LYKKNKFEEIIGICGKQKALQKYFPQIAQIYAENKTINKCVKISDICGNKKLCKNMSRR
jgi:hypothetical protein